MADSTPDKAVARLRVIILAMAGGILLFTGVATVLVARGTLPAQPDLTKPLAAALALFAVMEAPAYGVLRHTYITRARAESANWGGDDSPPPGVLVRFQGLTLVGGAMVEGLSLSGVVIFLLTAAWAALAVPLVGLVLLARLVPTRERLAAFAREVARPPSGT